MFDLASRRTPEVLDRGGVFKRGPFVFLKFNRRGTVSYVSHNELVFINLFPSSSTNFKPPFLGNSGWAGVGTNPHSLKSSHTPGTYRPTPLHGWQRTRLGRTSPTVRGLIVLVEGLPTSSSTVSRPPGVTRSYCGSRRPQ